MEERQDAPDFLREVAVEPKKVERNTGRTFLEEGTDSTKTGKVGHSRR